MLFESLSQITNYIKKSNIIRSRGTTEKTMTEREVWTVLRKKFYSTKSTVNASNNESLINSGNYSILSPNCGYCPILRPSVLIPHVMLTCIAFLKN